MQPNRWQSDPKYRNATQKIAEKPKVSECNQKDYRETESIMMQPKRLQRNPEYHDATQKITEKPRVSWCNQKDYRETERIMMQPKRLQRNPNYDDAQRSTTCLIVSFEGKYQNRFHIYHNFELSLIMSDE